MTQSSESVREEAKTTPLASGRFDRTSIILHWFTVLLIAVQFSSAWLHEMVDHNSSFAATLLDTHRNSGVLIWTVSMARLVWRHNYAYLPPFPEGMPRLQQTIAKANEYGLYALLLVQPITGLGRVLLPVRRFTSSYGKCRRCSSPMTRSVICSRRLMSLAPMRSLR